MDLVENESTSTIHINKISDKVRQINGQKIYRNVPESWVGEDPSRECEIFIGRIPRDCSLEKELVPLFEKAGHLFEFRLMVQFSGCNRGYGYAMYTNEEDAQRAIIKYNDFTIRPTWQLGVCRTDNNCRLFMKRLPMDLPSLEISKQIYQISDDVIEVYLKRGPQYLSAVIEFRNHRGAAIARKMLVPIALSNWGTAVQVDWSRHDWYLDFTQYLEVAHREGNEIRIRSIDKVKLRGNFVAGRSGGRSHSSYRRNKMILEAQSKRSSSAENPFPRNFNVKELTAKILQYTGRQTPPMPESEPSNSGARYRAILSTTAIQESADNSASHQKTETLSIRQRPIPQPLDLHKRSGFQYYGSEMSGSPSYADSNMSSSSSTLQETLRYNSSMEMSSPNCGTYYSSSMFSPRTPSNFNPSNPNPFSLNPSNFSPSNYSPSIFTPSPSPWSSQLDSNSPRFKFPSSSNIASSCSPSLCSPSMFDDNLSPFSLTQNGQVFFPSNSQGSDSRRFSGTYPSEGFGTFDQRSQLKSEIVSHPTFDFDRIMATDSFYSFAGQLSSGLPSGHSGNVGQADLSQEVDTFGVKGLLEKANDDAESKFFDQSILPSEDCKDEDMLLNFMKSNSRTLSDEEYNIWGFSSNTSPREDTK